MQRVYLLTRTVRDETPVSVAYSTPSKVEAELERTKARDVERGAKITQLPYLGYKAQLDGREWTVHIEEALVDVEDPFNRLR